MNEQGYQGTKRTSPNGEIVWVYSVTYLDTGMTVERTRTSRDGGRTWSEPKTIGVTG